MLDEHTRECLAIEVTRSIRAITVINALARLMRGRATRPMSGQTRAPSSSRALSCAGCGAGRLGPVFTAPGKPWQRGFVESFNGKLRDQCLSWVRAGLPHPRRPFARNG